MRGKIYNRNLKKIFLSFLAIVTLMSIFNYIIFQNSMTGMYNQVKENNQLVVRNMIQAFDNCFRDIDNVFYTIDMFGLSDATIYASTGHENFNFYNAYMGKDKLSDILSTSPEYVEDIIIYSDKSNMILTPDGTIRMDDLFNKKYSNSKYSISFWRNFSNTSHPMQIIGPDMYVDRFNFNRGKELMVIVSGNIVNKRDATVLVVINKGKLLNHVNYDNILEGTALILLDDSNNIVLNIGEKSIIDELNRADLVVSGNSFKNRNYEYHIEKSEYNNFTYIHILPISYAGMFKMVKTNRNILIINILCGIIGSLLLSLYLYNPLKHILSMFGVTPQSQKIGDGWQYIGNNIEMMQKEKRDLRLKVSDMAKKVQVSIFWQMIQTDEYQMDLKEQVDLYFSPFFQEGKYVLILFNFYPVKGANMASFDGVYMSEQVEGMLGAIFSHSFATSGENHQIMALAGVSHDYERDQVVEALNKVQNHIKEYITVIGISKFYNSDIEFGNAYNDVKICMSCRNIRPSNQIIDIENIEYNPEMYYPDNLKDKIYNYILSGNSDKCKKLMHDVLDENLKKNILYIKYVNIVTDIFNCIIQTLAFCGYDQKTIFTIEKNFLNMLEGQIEDDEIRWLLDTIIEQSAKKVNMSGNKLNKAFIIEYINLHYMEDLYLDNISEVVGTTPKYFSNFFKREFGINFVDYLNQVRINHAKEYLKNSNMTIKDIGEKVGYASPTTFTTTFKKYCGVSPSKYRENAKA
ncbi:MAG: helix-turn-helix domain-containing protein [Xylanivirga thermophila]|uniref:helix-turn-helix transcriptional regulator n=1 Tax=Xylanivirga thermophila TaxID=2496273 RepID=UPI0039F4F46B